MVPGNLGTNDFYQDNVSYSDMSINLLVCASNGAPGTVNFTMTNNLMWGSGSALTLQANTNATITGNKVYSTSSYSGSYPSNTWATSKPSTWDTTIIHPFTYEKGAHIAVLNAAGLTSKAIDFSGFLSPGDKYTVVDAQNYYGTPLVSNATYSGGTVTLSLNGTSMPAVIGNDLRQMSHTRNEFNVFVVMATGTAGVTTQSPTVTTTSASGITTSSATLNGTVNPNGSSATYRFDYGLTTSYGSSTSNVSAGSGSSVVAGTASISGLSANTAYHYRISATNAGGTSLGSDATFTTSALAATTYYVDATNGSDAAAGTSSATAWKTVAHINAQSFSAGTSILFKRGEIWREYLGQTGGNPTTWNGTAANPIVFDAYGTGAKPKFLGSTDVSSTSYWTLNSGNVWKTTATFGSDVGNLIFNNETSAGFKRYAVAELARQGDFCFNSGDNKVYLYSANNPGTYYAHIEAALMYGVGSAFAHIIPVYGESHLVFRNLDLRSGGWIGLHCYGNSSDITTEYCNFAWLGGSYGSDSTRAGNGWQTWRGGTDLVVRYCTFNQCYDDACDVEGSGTGDTYKRIRFYYNVVSNCHYGFQFMPHETDAGTVVDSCFWENNTVYNTGGEWSYNQRGLSYGDTHVACAAWSSSDMGNGTTNYTGTHLYVRNNIFDQGADNLLYQREWSTAALGNLTLRNNLYYTTPADTIIIWDRYGYASQEGFYTNSQFATYQSNTGKDAGSLMSNPLLNVDYSLQSGSPAINAGLNIGYTQDILGNAFVGTPDIGAYEFQSTTSVPPAPVASAASNVGANGFTANWASVSGATGYRIDVGTNPSFTVFVTGDSSRDVGSVTSFAVTGLSPGVTYYYRLAAYNTAGLGGFSNVISMTTIAPPSTPVTIAASWILTTGFTANWITDLPNTIGYYLDVSTSSGFGSFVTGYNSKNVDAVSSALVTGLSANTAYYYRVRAFNTAGTSPSSNTTTVTTLPNPVVAPSAPTATAATNVTQFNFVANWGAVSAATGYYLDVATDNGFTSLVTGFNNLDAGNVIAKLVSPLAKNTTYYYRVRAYNSAGPSASSNTITVATTDTVPNAPVADLPTSVTTSGFTANWEADAGALTYRLDVATDPLFVNYVSGYQDLAAGAVTTYPVTGLIPNTIYYYRVRAVNGVGTTVNSNVVTVTTNNVVPSPTTNYKRSIILQAKP